MTMIETISTTIRAHTCDAQWTAEGLARAVLVAMREPTDDMLKAPMPDPAGIYAHPIYESRRDLRPVIWRVMIDAALAET